MAILLPVFASMALPDDFLNHEKSVSIALKDTIPPKMSGILPRWLPCRVKLVFKTPILMTASISLTPRPVRGNGKACFSKVPPTKYFIHRRCSLTIQSWCVFMPRERSSPSAYQPRMTMNWVNGNGNWVAENSHYPPANYGRVHKTHASAFGDQTRAGVRFQISPNKPLVQEYVIAYIPGFIGITGNPMTPSLKNWCGSRI